MVTIPATTHAINSQKGEATVRLMSAETMKIPDPIIEPATSMVASVSVIALTNSRDDGAVSAVAVVVVKTLPSDARFFRPVVASRTAGRSYPRNWLFAREPACALTPSVASRRSELVPPSYATDHSHPFCCSYQFELSVATTQKMISISAVSRLGLPSAWTPGLNRIALRMSATRLLYPPSRVGLNPRSLEFPFSSTSKKAFM